MKKLLSLLTAVTMIGSMAFVVSAEEFSFASGDVDMDGVITGHDAAIVSLYADGKLELELTEDQLNLADMNNDGIIDAADAALIAENQQYELGDVDLAVNFDVYSKIDISKCDLSDAAIAADMTCCSISEVAGSYDKDYYIRADVDCNGVVDECDAYAIMEMYSLISANKPVLEDGKFYFNFDENAFVQERTEYLSFMFSNRDDKLAQIEKVETIHDLFLFEHHKTLMLTKFDMDGDGELTVGDGAKILQVYADTSAEIVVYSDDEYKKMDINGDGNVNLEDACIVLSAYAREAVGLS